MKAANEVEHGWDAWSRVALALLFGLLVLLTLRQIDSLDIGFHLRVGNSVLDGEGWPRTDRFSFTMTEHPYVDTSWGFQVLLASIERAAGPTGMTLLLTAFAVATFSLLLATARLGRAPPAVLLVLMLAGVLTCEMRFLVRPEWLSYTLLAGVLYLLHRHAERRSAPLWLLPPVFWVWVNCHSLFLLGLISVGCAWIGGWIERGKPDRALGLWALAALAACTINPYGVGALTHTLSLLTRFEGSNLFHKIIAEFRSPLGAAVDARMTPLFAFRIFAALSFVGTFLLLRRNRWWCVLVVVAMAVPALSMVRNMPILIVAAFAPAAWGLADWAVVRRRSTSRVIAVLTSLVALTLGLRVSTDAYYVDMGRNARTGLGLNDIALPIEATEHAIGAGFEGRMLNHLNLGGYLMWATGQPVFVDGRLEVVGEEFFLEAHRALVSAEERAEQTARFGLGWAIVPTGSFPEIVRSFSEDEAWRLTHVDAVAAVFERRPGAADEGLPEPPPLRLDDLPGLPGGPPRPSRFAAWAEGLFTRRSSPLRHHELARFHLARGETEASAAHLTEAIRIDGGRRADLYTELGLALADLGRRADADACLRLALAADPSDPRAREALAGER